jgi:hypothetical protein
MQSVVSNDAPTVSIRYVMSLKKRSLSLVGRGLPTHHCYKRWELVACGQERLTAKGLGFFGHVTWQASGWCQTTDRQNRERKLKAFSIPSSSQPQALSQQV